MPYARAYESLGDAVTISDPSDTLVFINSAGEELYGYDRSELLGRPLSRILPAGAQFVGTATLQASTNEKWEGEVTRARKSGEEFPAQLTVTLLRNDDDVIIGTTGIVRDLTEIRRLADENAVLAEVGRIIGSTLDIDDVYERFASEVGKLIPFDRISIGIPDAVLEYITIAYMSGIPLDSRKRGDRLALEGTLALRAVQSMSTVLMQGVTREYLEAHIPVLVSYFDKGLRSFLSVPLTHHDRVVGVLQIRSTQDSAYSETSVRLAERVGIQIAGAVANSLLYAQLQDAESEQRRLSDENAVLAELGRIIGSTLDIDQVYGRFAEEVRNLIPFDRISIATVDLEAGTLTHAHVSGVAVPGWGPGDVLPLAESVNESSVASRNGHLLELDPQRLGRGGYDAQRLALKAGLRSGITLPLLSRGVVVGTLNLRSKQADAYTEQDLKVAERVAAQIAGAIANSELHRSVLRDAKERAIMAEIGRTISSTLDIDEVYSRFAKRVGELIQFDRININLLVSEDEEFITAHVTGVDIPGRRAGEVGRLTGTFMRAVMLKKAGLIFHPEDIGSVEALYPSLRSGLDAGFRSFLGVPLVSEGRVIGTLHFQSAETNAYSARNLRLAEQIGAQIAGAIANAQLYERVEQEVTERIELHATVRQAAHESEVLAKVSRAVSSSTDLNEVLDLYAGTVGEIIPVDAAGIGLIDHERQTVTPRHVTVNSEIDLPPRDGRVASRLEGSVSAEVLEKGTPVVIQCEDPRQLGERGPQFLEAYNAGIRSFLAVPVTAGDRVTAVIHFSATDPDAYGPNEVAFAEKVATQISGAVAIARLYADLETKESQLQGSEERNRAIVQAIPDLIFRVRGDGTFLDFQGAKDARSLPSEVWMGKPLAAVMPPDVTELAMRSINRAILTGQVQEFEYSLPLPMPDGEVRDWEGRAVKAGDDEVLILARDITERKRLSAELLQAQKMEAVGTLAGGVAHDFNNMLTAIHGYTDLAAATPGIASHVRGYHDEVRKAADRAAGLTRQLLAFSRRQIENRKVIDLNDVILDMDRMLRRLIREDIELVTLPAKDLRLVHADPGHIEQVLMNLVVNASDAMPEGGKLVIETLNIDVDDELASQHGDLACGDYAGLTVRDTGEGMTTEVQSRIFDPFFTTKEVGKGTGLGLSTVYGIITQNGGAITVESEHRVGTTFRVLLPAVQDAKEDLPLRDDTGFLPAGSETILLVEDESLVRGVEAEVLRHQGYTVIEAANGVEALEAALKVDRPIDLLVTDVVMPLMGGKELADRLKGSHPEIKVLYSTGYTEDTALIRELAGDAQSLLQKPFGPTELAERVRSSLDRT